MSTEATIRRAGPGDYEGAVRLMDALSMPCIDPAWRGRGIGRQLTRAFESWAIGAGAPWVEVNVYAVNDEARRFYESLGYLPFSAKLHKPA